MKKNGKRPPSLSEKFVHIAAEANLPDWKEDVEAFKKFNLIRNGLIHQGKQKVSFHIAVGEVSEQRVAELEDLVERYVNWHLFGESKIYQSHANRKGVHPSRIKPIDK